MLFLIMLFLILDLVAGQTGCGRSCAAHAYTDRAADGLSFLHASFPSTVKFIGKRFYDFIQLWRALCPLHLVALEVAKLGLGGSASRSESDRVQTILCWALSGDFPRGVANGRNSCEEVLSRTF